MKVRLYFQLDERWGSGQRDAPYDRRIGRLQTAPNICYHRHPSREFLRPPACLPRLPKICSLLRVAFRRGRPTFAAAFRPPRTTQKRPRAMTDPAPACFDCATMSTERLIEMFIDMVQKKRIALGQKPAQRPVFRKLHGVAHARLEMLPDMPADMKVVSSRMKSSTPGCASRAIRRRPIRIFNRRWGIGIKLYGVPGPNALGEDGDNRRPHHAELPGDSSSTTRRRCASSPMPGVVGGNYDPYLDTHPETKKILDAMARVEGSVLTTTYWAILPFRLGRQRDRQIPAGAGHCAAKRAGRFGRLSRGGYGEPARDARIPLQAHGSAPHQCRQHASQQSHGRMAGGREPLRPNRDADHPAARTSASSARALTAKGSPTTSGACRRTTRRSKNPASRSCAARSIPPAPMYAIPPMARRSRIRPKPRLAHTPLPEADTCIVQGGDLSVDRRGAGRQCAGRLLHRSGSAGAADARARLLSRQGRQAEAPGGALPALRASTPRARSCASSPLPTAARRSPGRCISPTPRRRGFTFQLALDIPEAADAPQTTLRNPAVPDRTQLAIVPSPRTVEGRKRRRRGSTTASSWGRRSISARSSPTRRRGWSCSVATASRRRATARAPSPSPTMTAGTTTCRTARSPPRSRSTASRSTSCPPG